MQIKFNHSVFLPHSCGRCGVFKALSYVYPVYLFTFIDYLVRCSCFLIVPVYTCTWFCDDVCILQAQYDGNDVTAALLVH